MKLNTFIAHAGFCSRRKAADLVKTGIVRVNGIVFQDPSYNVKETDTIVVEGKKLQAQKKIYLILNKPKGYVTTVSDEAGRATVIDLIADYCKERLYPIGRLDKDTTGLLLLTNDGTLAHQLAHPRYKILKVYQVHLNADLSDESIATIKKGVYLEDGKVIVDELMFCSPHSKTAIRIIIHGGKKRIIRRLFERLGYEVKSLDRVSYAGLSLHGLGRGHWRSLTKTEVARLYKLVENNKKDIRRRK